MSVSAPVRLDRYLDEVARYREVVLLRGSNSSLLVIDRLADSAGDPRLVARLESDEPASNALLICHQYLSDPAQRWCRPLTRRDIEGPPAAAVTEAAGVPEGLLEARSHRYRLEHVPNSGRAGSELRWVRMPTLGGGGREVVSLRSVIAAIEDYDPARSMSVRAVESVRGGRQRGSVAALMAEVRRIDSSPIVLNRGLREAVLHAVDGGLSLSAIAMRCGRIKRDQRGNISGETSWLGRRLGLLPEGGSSHPTPWVHSEVLGLICRRGLGLCPREVELG